MRYEMENVNLTNFVKCDDASPYQYKHLWRNEALLFIKDKVYLYHYTEKFNRRLSYKEVSICEHQFGGNICAKCAELPLI